MTEGSIAAGVRRIEAVTAEGAQSFVFNELDQLNSIREQLKFPKDLGKTVDTLLKDRADLQKELEKSQMQMANQLKSELVNQVENRNGVNVLIHKGSFSSSEVVKQMSFDLKREIEDLFLLILADVDGKPLLSVMMSESLTDRLNAGELVRTLAKHIKGGGGGQPYYATAGGKDVSGLNLAEEEARKILEEKL